MPHLWEVEHPYYCSESNYYSNDPGESYDSWADFLENCAGGDPDLNLIFRFDWREGEDNGASAFNGDPLHRSGNLQIFWMMQRKGIFACTEVKVCRADEPGVIEFLLPRWRLMQKLWEPFSDRSDVV